MTRSLPFLLLLAPLTFGDDKPAPKPTTPAASVAETVVKFPPTPVLPPAVGAPVVLNADELYVVEATGECFLRSFPAGLVKVTKEQGPIRVRAKFAGNTNVSTRSFAGPYVYVVEPVASGDTTLVVVPKGVTADDKIKTQVISVNVGPRPPPVPPGPTPGPTPPGPTPTPPTPQPDPSPFPGTGLRVLMVYETGATLPVGQGPILFGKEVREYLDSKTPLGPDGKTHEWRIYDKDVTGLENEAATWKDAMARPRKSVPWILVGNGKAGYEGPLPATVAETMALLKKFAE